MTTTPSPELLDLDALRKIGILITTQDNRITDQPMFIVQQRRRMYGLDTGYCENFIWLCSEDEYNEASAEEADALEAEYQDTGRAKDGWQRTGYIDQWEFVTACFTEQGCIDYLKLDGHNLNEPRIYAEGSYRNEEFRAVRNSLIALARRAQPEGEARCVICGSDEPRTGTCGSDDPRALCKTPAATLSPLCGAQHAESGKEVAVDEIRACGWAVAVHNDYRLHGEAHTFWLFTKDGRAVKGEGKTDAEALEQVRAEIGLAAQQAAAPVPELEAAFDALESYGENGDYLLASDVYDAFVKGGSTSAPGTPEAPTDKTMPGWERGIATVTLNGHQLREALDFINPDGAGDPDQLDDDLTFGIVQYEDDEGKAKSGMCCWNDDTDGVLPLDSEPRAAQLDGGQGEGQ